MDRKSLREALVVGINSYPFLKKKKLGDLNLKAAIKDAEAIANMLEKYGKFRVQRLPKGYDEEGKERFEPRGTVRIDELKQAIINLFQPPIKNETPDVALLFFAGHGFVNTKGDIREGVLVTSEAQFLENISENDNISGISLSWLKEFLQDSLVKKQIVWLDCCFSGELLNFDGVANPNTQEKQVSRCFITASRSFQTATEKIDGKQGLFTDSLLECLNPENHGNGWVTNHILTESIQERMSQTSQAPMCYNSGSTIILTTNSLTEPLDERWKNVPPYRGLSYFGQQENDGVFFHGRTGLTDKLIEQVKNHNFVAVLGASGSGKSSLLRAGLLYQLKRGQKISGSDRWLCIDPFTPEEFPLKSLLKSLGKSLLEIKIKGEKVERLIQFIHQIEGKKVEFLTKELIEEKLIEFIDVVEAERVIMVMDQFEESFTLCKTHEERREFFDCFLAVLERRGEKFCVVLGIRADFLGRCSEYGGLANKIQGHQLLVTPLEEDEIEEVIKKPAALVAMDVEPNLVAQMREDFLRNPGSLPLLEYTLDALWKFATQGEEKSQYLTLETYTNLGGIEGTLTKRADAVFDSLSEEEKSVAQRIFLELVQPGEGEISSGKITDTRRRVILEKLPNERHSLELLSAVTDKLADKNNRLITKDKSEAGILLDIIHEDLIRSWKTLRKWVEEYQEALPVERKIEADAAEWEKDGKSENLLLRAGRLTKAEEYLKIYGEMALLDGLAYEFIEASRELSIREEEKEKERQRQVEEKRVKILGMLSDSMIRLKPSLFDTGVLLSMESMKQYFDIKKRYGKVDSDLLVELDKTLRNGVTQLPKHLHTLNHKSSVKAVAFSPDGKTIATASWDKTARLWDTDTGKELAILNHQDRVEAVAFSPDGKTIATESGKTARLWDTENGNVLATLNHQDRVKAVAFSPDGKTIATRSGNTARLWDTENGNELATLNHQLLVNAVAFSPDGKTIATASLDKTARLWDTENGNELATLNHQSLLFANQQSLLFAVAFSPDGKTIATASLDKTARLWDTENGNELATLNHQSVVNAVAFSPDGKTIATASDDNTARLWNAENGKELATLNHKSWVKAVAFSPDGKTIATASNDKTARLWDTENGNELATLNHQSGVNEVAFSPDGKTIATASDDNTACLWYTDTGNELATLNHQNWVEAVAFSPDGKTIATASWDHTARLWDTDTGKELATLNHQSGVNAVAFSPDGKTIATASNDNTARLWDTENGNELATLNHQAWVNAVAFSPDGKTIATASNDKTARLWDSDIGNVLATLNHQSGVNEVAFSPDGKTIATASDDNTACLWNAENGNELATLNHQSGVNEVAFSPDGKTIATASNDNTARLWNAENGNELATLNHQSGVNEVAFSPDGKTIATASDDNTACLWDTDTGNELATLNHQHTVKAVAFSSDGKTIATASYDNTVRLHWVTSERFIPEACSRLSRNLTAKEWQQYINSDLETYQKTCENLPVHPSLILEAKNLAKTGEKENIKQAISLFKKALELEPEIDLEPDTETRETDPQLVANKFAAAGKVEEGQKLAKDGKIEEAIALFKNAQELSPEIDLAPETETKETDPQLVANQFVVSFIVEESKNLAKQGKIEEAITLFKKVQELSSEIDLTPGAETKETDPQFVANKFVVSVVVEEGKNLAKQGEIEEAISLFKKIQKLSSEIDLDKEQQRQIEEQIVKLLGMLSDSIIKLKPSLFETGVLLGIESMKQYFDIKKRYGKANSDLLVELDQTLRNGLTQLPKYLHTLNHQDEVIAVAFSPDGKTIATASSDKTARLWDTENGNELATFNHQSRVIAVAFSPDGKTIATASSDKTARLWDTDTGNELAILYHQKTVRAVAFSPDGKTIATASNDYTARLWDTENGNELATLNHQDSVRAVAFSPDGKTIATATYDKTARLWDTDTGKELATLNHQDDVNAVAFSPDGKTIATASNDYTARLWDTENGKELATLNHQSMVKAVAFSPDGKTIATASWDQTARLWDTENGNGLATLNHQSMVEAVAFSPDGQTIATTTKWDKTARLWGTKNGKQLAILNHQRDVNAVAFSPDGQTIATASDDKTSHLWNTDAGKELATLNHQDIVKAVAFSPDGQTAATANDDTTACLHGETVEVLIQESCERLSRNLTAEEWQKYINSDLEKYQKTCENLPVHPSLIAEAKNLVKTGTKENLKKAIDISKKALELSPEIDITFVASDIVEEGKKLAKQGKIEEAIYLFKNAQEFSPEIDLTFVASDIVEEGKKLAKQGKIEEAIALFKNAQELLPEIDLTFVASDIVEEGKKLAKQGKIEEAIALFKKAQELSPEIDLAPDTETKETDPQFVANKLAALSKVEEGKKLAKQGKIEEAIALFKKAQELSPEIDLTPDAETRETDPQLVPNKFVVSVIVEEIKNLARQGKIEEAIYLFKKVQELSSEIDLDKEQQRQIEEQIVKLLGMLSDSIIRLKPSLFDTGVLLSIESMKQYFDIKKRYGKANSDLLVELDQTLRNGLTQLPKHLHTLNHQGRINAVAFSPDGKTVATASYDNTACLWDTDTGKELAILNHQDSVNAVAFSPDGKTMATRSNTTASLWETENGKELATLNHHGWVNAVAFSPDGKTIATASYDKTARLWDTDTGKELAILNHQEWVRAVAFSPDGKTIATASDDNTARLWDTNTGNELATLNHQGDVRAVVFSPDSKTIATASYDKTARLWDTDTGKELAILNHQGDVRAVVFSPDSKTIATASWDNTARLWDTDTGKELAILNHEYRLIAVAFSPDGKTIATASDDKTSRLWDTRNGKQLAILNHQDRVSAVAFSPDGKTIATASNDKTSRLWDTDPGKELATLNHQDIVKAVAFSPDGQTAATANDDTTACLHGETVEVLIQESCERLSRNLTAEEWQKYINSDLEKYQKTCENIPVHPSIIAEAKNLVKKGTKENLKKAIDISKKALELSPEIDITFVASDIVEEGKKLAKQGKIEEAIYLFKKAQELSPEIDLAPDTENRETDPQIVANKLAAPGKVEEGQQLAKQGKIEEAIVLFKKAQEFSPEIDLTFVASDIVEEGKKLAKQGKIEEAIVLFKKAQELSPEIDLEPNTENRETDPQLVANKLAASGKVEEGQKLTKDGKIEEAIALFKKAQELSPEIDFNFVFLEIVEEGEKLAKQGKREEAIALLNNAELVANKLAAPSRVEEGKDLARQGKIEEAIALFKNIQELLPEIDLTFVVLEIVEEGKKLAKQGKREEAIALFKNAQLVVNKFVAPRKVEAGKNLARQGKIETAIYLFKKAQELSPEIDLDPNTETRETDPQIVANKFAASGKVEEGQKLAKQGKIEEAIYLFKKAQELSPEIDLTFVASDIVEEGKKLAKEGKIEEAIALFKKAQELSPEIDLEPDTKTRETDPQLVANKFAALGKEKEIEDKKAALDKIIEGRKLAKDGKIEEAIYLFKNAQKLSPEINLAFVASDIVKEGQKLAKQGKIEEAIALFKDAQELSPEIDLDPNTETKETDPQLVANKLAAPSRVEEGKDLARQGKIEEAITLFKNAQELSPEIDLTFVAADIVEEGKKLAKQGKIEEAIALFKNAQELSPEIDLDPNTETRETDPQIVANRFAASGKVEEGKKLAKQGKIEEAITLFKNAQELSPEIDLAPDTKTRETDPQLVAEIVAKKYVVSVIVEESKNLAKQGQIEEAIYLFKKAQELSPEIDLAPDTKTRETDPQLVAEIVAKKYVVSVIVEESIKLAKQGQIEEAIYLFKKAQKLSPEIPLDPDFVDAIKYRPKKPTVKHWIEILKNRN